MDFFEQLQAINSREDFEQFLPILLNTFEKNKHKFANNDIPSFLLALQYIIEDLELAGASHIHWHKMASILHVALLSPIESEEL